MKCPICLSKVEDIKELEYYSYKHENFNDLKNKHKICQCPNCSLIFNNEVSNIEELCKSKNYSESQQTAQKKNKNTRSAVQAKYIAEKLVNDKSNSVLDIGCFDGSLLKEIAELESEIQLFGYDINPYLKNSFVNSDINFISSSLDDITEKFDLISLSHSIIYFKDLNLLFKQIKRMLKADGILFIQTPDILKNPIYALMGDQYYYFTRITIENLLNNMGFSVSFIEDNNFSRECALFAELAEIEDVKVENELNNIILDLELVKEKLLLAKFDNIGVLGTTANAAFIDNIINVKYFVDESGKKMFRGKKVFHPKNLTEEDKILVCYGESSKHLAKKLNKKYKS